MGTHSEMSVNADDKWKRKFIVCHSSAGQTTSTKTKAKKKNERSIFRIDTQMNTNPNSVFGQWPRSAVPVFYNYITLIRDQTNGKENWHSPVWMTLKFSVAAGRVVSVSTTCFYITPDKLKFTRRIRIEHVIARGKFQPNIFLQLFQLNHRLHLLCGRRCADLHESWERYFGHSDYESLFVQFALLH